MSSYSLLSSNSSENDHPDDMSFEIMDFLTFGEHPREETSARDQPPFWEQSHVVLQENSSEASRTSGGDCSKQVSQSARASSSKGGRMKVAFKTKSELEVLDDGYKWRKYGKKMVKNSPNPRNYYRCSSDGCNVKKRVQREKEDSRYVITTYEGVHNHHALLPASADYEASGKDTLANCFQESHV
ncbi:probable WRKY transcription factor 75 isoform X1 [Ananas comosus]|uniref:Probable WRKY transcription factor 75 isoform X1 n=1 Tax=Ananas comosus TaxID=4615 RepID=A0A6P5GHF0_ANACO|nr:probable WRKY transcription factor 75 isoform X1 [Ananas comosus]